MPVRIPTDIKARRAITIDGHSYIADARITVVDLEFLARTNALSALLSKGVLYPIYATPRAHDKFGGHPGIVQLPVGVTQAILAAEETQDAPAIPTSVVATAATTTTVSVAFTPGAAGTGAITNYEYKVGTGAWTALSPVDTSSPITVPVTAGASGTLRIRAVSAYGQGVQSAATAYSVALPDPPTAVAGDVTGNSLAITFTPPVAGGQVTNYEYRIGQTDLTQNPWVTVTPDDNTSPITVDVAAYGTPALTPILGANLRLRALNGALASTVTDPVVIT